MKVAYSIEIQPREGHVDVAGRVGKCIFAIRVLVGECSQDNVAIEHDANAKINTFMPH